MNKDEQVADIYRRINALKESERTILTAFAIDLAGDLDKTPTAADQERETLRQLIENSDKVTWQLMDLNDNRRAHFEQLIDGLER